ncbi:MAG: T9SS type A sorting domain-containing protein [Paludibacter sp.]|nr:T9SS type A sorting domain-containing protein [Paludibacter sp.]
MDIIADQNKQTAIPIVKDNVGSEFNIFPVVNNGNFNIKLNNIANSGTVEIQIIEVGSGKLVYSKSITFDNSILSVNQSGALLNGMYLVRIKSNESSVVRKMIVQ